MDVISYSKIKKVKAELDEHKEEYVQHQNSTMPHIFYDLKNNKKYRFGLQCSTEGNPQIIFEEVIE